MKLKNSDLLSAPGELHLCAGQTAQSPAPPRLAEETFESAQLSDKVVGRGPRILGLKSWTHYLDLKTHSSAVCVRKESAYDAFMVSNLEKPHLNSSIAKMS